MKNLVALAPVLGAISRPDAVKMLQSISKVTMLGDNNHISLLKVLFTMMTNLNLFDDVKHGFE